MLTSRKLLILTVMTKEGVYAVMQLNDWPQRIPRHSGRGGRGGGGGCQVFKKWGLDRASTLRGGLLEKRGLTLRGVGVQFFTKIEEKKPHT